MNARLNLSGSPLAAKSMKYMASASKVVIEDSTLPKSTENMVMLRASQINGCGFCTDIHTKDAAHAGETPVRINLVAAWRESKVFTDAERAALDGSILGVLGPNGAGTRPPVLFLDEPTAGLDPASRLRMCNVIANWSRAA